MVLFWSAAKTTQSLPSNPTVVVPVLSVLALLGVKLNPLQIMHETKNSTSSGALQWLDGRLKGLKKVVFHLFRLMRVLVLFVRFHKLDVLDAGNDVHELVRDKVFQLMHIIGMNGG